MRNNIKKSSWLKDEKEKRMSRLRIKIFSYYKEIYREMLCKIHHMLLKFIIKIYALLYMSTICSSSTCKLYNTVLQRLYNIPDQRDLVVIFN